MPKPEVKKAELPARKAASRPKAETPAVLKYVGTDIDAFCAAQEEALARAASTSRAGGSAE
ncbi:MAG TPA: hypothetical protein VFS20_30870 [Longimicrobium sp.]|nr:hypothetical protein [Longimicrobium sp.]